MPTGQNRYLYFPEGDTVIVDGWAAGEDRDVLLVQVNAVLATLPYAGVKPMTLNGLRKRMTMLHVKRQPGWIASAVKRRNARRTDRPERTTPMPTNPDVLEGEGYTKAIETLLAKPRDGMQSRAIIEIAREMREYGQCKIDRKGAIDWGRRNCRSANITPTLTEINATRLAFHLPEFVIT